MKATTPNISDLSAKEKEWLSSLSLHGPVALDSSRCELPASFCHLNVLYHLYKNPQLEIVSGWVLWRSRLITELEFHSVLKGPDGVVFDVTKRIDGESEILFFEEKHSRYAAVIDKGFTRSFHNVIFPKTGKKPKEILVFGGALADAFQNFKVHGRPHITNEQKSFMDSFYDSLLSTALT